MDIKLFIPMISVYLVGSFFPVNSRTNKEIPYRPPGWVFGVVWPVLLFLIGYSWTLRPQLTNYYIALTVLLSSWMISFTYNKKLAFLTILSVIALSIYLSDLSIWSLRYATSAKPSQALAKFGSNSVTF